MKILGIDYGEKKVGLAISESILAEPYKVIRCRGEEIFGKIKKVIEDEGIELIVVGLSEGATAERTKIFTDKLKDFTQIPINFSDETLSTKISQDLALKSGINRKKRKEMEDAFAAAVMLQNYIDKG